jgi:hypothetical protein
MKNKIRLIDRKPKYAMGVMFEEDPNCGKIGFPPCNDVKTGPGMNLKPNNGADFLEYAKTSVMGTTQNTQPGAVFGFMNYGEPTKAALNDEATVEQKKTANITSQTVEGEPFKPKVDTTLRSTPPTEGSEEDKKKKEEDKKKKEQPFQIFNPYGSVDIPTAAAFTGMAIQNKDAFGIVAGGLKTATGLARNIASGMGFQKVQNEIKAKLAEDNKNNDTFQNKAMGGVIEGQSENQEINLGRYKDSKYFNVKKSMGGFIVEPTKTNPQTTKGHLAQLEYLRNLNPEQSILNNETYLQAVDRKAYMAKGGEMLTGEYVSGMDSGGNAEVEDGEYLKDLSGTVQEVVGKKHSEGGELMQLEAGERVLSDQMKVDAKAAKKISEQLDMEVKKGVTYASVLDKYRKKIGLEKLIDEEGKVIESIDNQFDVEDEATKKVNETYLQQRYQEVQEQKEELEQSRSAAFDVVFDIQESSKPKSQQQAPEMAMEEFAMGGEMLENLAREYNIPIERAMELMQGVPSYALGVEVESPGNPTKTALINLVKNGKITFEEALKIDPTLKSVDNPNSKDYVEGETQRFTKDGMAGDTNPENIKAKMTILAQQFPEIVAENFDENFKPKSKESFRLLQQGMQARYTALLSEIDQKVTDPEQKQRMQNRVRAEMFQDGVKNKNIDNVGGDFTLSRINFSFEDLIDEPDVDLGMLDEIVLTGKKDPPPVVDEVTKRNYMGLMESPGFNPMFPSALQGTLKPERQFDRLKAMEIDPTPFLNQVREQEQLQIKNLEGLSPNVRAAVMANMNANSLSQKSDMLNKIDMQNLNNFQNVANLNVGTQRMEENAGEADALGYENRIFKAQALTRNDINNFFNANEENNATKFYDIQRMNLMNARRNDVVFDGTNFRTTNDDSKYDAIRNMLGNYDFTDEEKEKLKGISTKVGS